MKKINRTIIFSTRYLKDEPHSIFYGYNYQNNQSILNQKCLIKLERVNSGNVLDIFNINDSPEQLINVARILKNEDDKARLSMTESAIEDEILQKDIVSFFKNHSKLSDDCLTSLSKYIYPNISYEHILIIDDSDENVIYRAIGIEHLPDGQNSNGKNWARILANEFSYGDLDSEEIYICLHSGTDWKEEKTGYLSDFSKELSDKLSKNISVFTYHHQPQTYIIADKLLSKGESLNSIWDAISKLKKL